MRKLSENLPRSFYWVVVAVTLSAMSAMMAQTISLNRSAARWQAQADAYERRLGQMIISSAPASLADELSALEWLKVPVAETMAASSAHAGYWEKFLADTDLPKVGIDAGGEPGPSDFTNRQAVVSGTFLYKIQNQESDGSLLVYDAPESLRLIYLDAKTKTGYAVANSREISYTGNSGGLWFPVALTSDGLQAVMCAVMGDPGAGGGDVDYGCGFLPLKPLDGREYFLWPESGPNAEDTLAR